jgi:hypothetical protein
MISIHYEHDKYLQIYSKWMQQHVKAQPMDHL